MAGDSGRPDRGRRRSQFRRKTKLPGGFVNGRKTNKRLITRVPPVYRGEAGTIE